MGAERANNILIPIDRLQERLGQFRKAETRAEVWLAQRVANREALSAPRVGDSAPETWDELIELGKRRKSLAEGVARFPRGIAVLKKWQRVLTDNIEGSAKLAQAEDLKNAGHLDTAEITPLRDRLAASQEAVRVIFPERKPEGEEQLSDRFRAPDGEVIYGKSGQVLAALNGTDQDHPQRREKTAALVWSDLATSVRRQKLANAVIYINTKAGKLHGVEVFRVSYDELKRLGLDPADIWEYLKLTQPQAGQAQPAIVSKEPEAPQPSTEAPAVLLEPVPVPVSEPVPVVPEPDAVAEVGAAQPAASPETKEVKKAPPVLTPVQTAVLARRLATLSVEERDKTGIIFAQADEKELQALGQGAEGFTPEERAQALAQLPPILDAVFKDSERAFDVQEDEHGLALVGVLATVQTKEHRAELTKYLSIDK